MSEWITDRLPTAEDAVASRGMVIISDNDGDVYTIEFQDVRLTEPWMPLPAPYVKPKRWTVGMNVAGEWWLYETGTNVVTRLLCLNGPEYRDLADQIEDLINGVRS